MIELEIKQPKIDIELQGVTIKKNADVEELTVTENGTYRSDKDGFQPVIVDVPLPTGKVEITENGTHNVYNYAEADVNVQPTLQDKTITKNGVYSADEGYNGLSEVTVDVPKVSLKTFLVAPDVTSFSADMLDTSNTTKLSGAFYNCSRLIELDLSSWDTSNVTAMDQAFFGCASLTNLDISSWDTSHVLTLRQMFYNCSGLTKLDLSSWDTSNVTVMDYVFQFCASLTKIDLSSWDTRNSTMSSAFYHCANLASVKLGANAFLNVTTASALLSNTRTYYVPDNMVDTFKAATNWSNYASQIKGWSEIPEGLFD